MKSILLIRHGETIWNVEAKIQGCQNIYLTKKGIQQGKSLIKRLLSMDRKFIKVYTSDLKRCSIISNFISKELNIILEEVKDFREMDFGKWEGLSINEIKEQYKEVYFKWRSNPKEANIPDGENLIKVQKRCLVAIKQIINSYNEGTVIIVSHSIAIKTIILGLLNIDLEHFYKMSIDNVSISEIEFRDYGPVLKLLNDTSHLKRYL